MGAVATYDAVNKLITLTAAPVGGFVTVDVQKDLYSAAKNDWLSDPVLNRFTFPWRTVGGDDVGGGKAVGAYFFLRNDLGWRIRPYDADHELILVGQLFGQDGAQQVVVPTTSSHQVLVQAERSLLTQSIQAGSGLDTSQSNQLREVWKLLGLDVADGVLRTDTRTRTESSDIVIDHADDGTTTSTNRQ